MAPRLTQRSADESSVQSETPTHPSEIEMGDLGASPTTPKSILKLKPTVCVNSKDGNGPDDNEEDEQPPIAFRTNYRDAGILSRMFFTYTKHLMGSVRELGKMEETFIEDMNSIENETQIMNDIFMANIHKRTKDFKLL